VAAFDFPPKKTVGNKGDKVVEDRRKRLQAYLRRLVNLLVQANPVLAAGPTKENVVLLFPFFGDSTTAKAGQQSPKAVARPRSRSHSRSLFGRRQITAAQPASQLAL